MAHEAFHSGDIPAHLFTFLCQVRTDGLPAFPIVISVRAKALFTQHKEETALGGVWVQSEPLGPLVTDATSSCVTLIPHHLISEGHAFTIAQATNVPQPPEVLRIAPHIRARIVSQERTTRLPPAHLKSIKLPGIEVVVDNPLGFLPHPIGGISMAEERLRVAHQPLHNRVIRTVPTDDPMFPTDPQLSHLNTVLLA